MIGKGAWLRGNVRDALFSARRGWLVGLWLLGFSIAPGGAARAGPPFLTDDPEPVEAGHWEIYAASQWIWSPDAASGTVPQFEVNYGAGHGIQLHAIVPIALQTERGRSTECGAGDVELGLKLRMLEESGHRPQVGVFPLLELPSGSEARGLGSGHLEAILPVWIQKSAGRWLTYGGGGIRIAPDGSRSVAGWLLQRQMSRRTAAGAEAFFTGPGPSQEHQLQLNAGLIVDFSPLQHLLLSAGPCFGTGDRGQAYGAYQLTF